MENERRDVRSGPVRVCPACERGELRRSRREAWMNWLPCSKYYSCLKCGAGFLLLFDLYRFRTVHGISGRGSLDGMSPRRAGKKLIVILSALTGLIYACYRIVVSLYEGAPQ